MGGGEKAGGVGPGAQTKAYALTFDVGGTAIKCALATRDGHLVARDTVPTERGGGEVLVAQLQGLREKWLSALQTGIPHYRPAAPNTDAGAHGKGVCIELDGPAPSTEELETLGEPVIVRACDLHETVGVAVPGIVDENAGMALKSVNLGWENFPMRERLQQAFASPVRLCHDVRSGALAEALWGAGNGADTYFVAIGTGIAAGLVLNGQLVSRAGWTGECGQLAIVDQIFSGHETVEKIASAHAVKQRYHRLRALETVASPADLGNKADFSNRAEQESPETEVVGTREVFARARAGDGQAQRVVDAAIEALGFSIASSIATLGPLRVVIGGGMSNEGPAYLEALARATASHLPIHPPLDFALAKLGSWAQSLGVGAQAFALDAAAEKTRGR